MSRRTRGFKKAGQAVEAAAIPSAPFQEPDNWSDTFGHTPVMGLEVMAALDIKPDGVYVDATMGGGGHSRMILEALGPAGKLISLDQDIEPLTWARDHWGRDERRLTAVQGHFEDLPDILADLGIKTIDGLLADLGLNSRQLLNSGRGFSWSEDEPLDMRLDPEGELTAAQVVNRYPEKQLADVIWRYGEERASRRLARAIAYSRAKAPLETTGQLAALVAKSLYRPGPPPRIHPATRTFMALRIEVNGELAALSQFLLNAPTLLTPGGRLAVISFHSLEDRLVKEALKSKTDAGPIWRPLYKKPLTPGQIELEFNPRSRSAKLRAGEKTAPQRDYFQGEHHVYFSNQNKSRTTL